MAANLFANEIFLSLFCSILAADVMKVLIHYLSFKRVDVTLFVKTGGMPSAHTAAVCAMTTSVYLTQGITDLFVITLMFSLIVITDAFGFRRSIGKQAEILNKMIDDIAMFNKFETKRLYELIGHTPKQVIIGGILGIIVANIVHFF